MDFRHLDIKKSYISLGENDIVTALINPALKSTKYYKRSVGFFSSSVFEVILDGIVTLARNGGSVQIISSPRLNENDIEAIRLGYEYKQRIIDERINSDFLETLNELEDRKLKLLVGLISQNIINIKIAVVQGVGIYHDKLGIMEDFSGNSLVFYGSSNASLSAYKHNYEKIRVVRSWYDTEEESVIDEIHEFESLWNNTNEFIEVTSFDEAAKRTILQVISKRKNGNHQNPIELRKYQEEAIRCWKENDYKGFYVMATGTGKTWTAIFSAIELLKYDPIMVVICAPYKHLIKQWEEDLKVIFKQTNIILISSENSKWEEELTNEIIRKKYEPDSPVVVVSTIASFQTDRFEAIIDKSNANKLLIVDEAHRFTKRPEKLKRKYKYMLGLSATPNNGKNIRKGIELLDFFGGMVFNLPIEEALDKGFLVPYNYFPIYVDASESEEDDFKKYTANMASCFKNGVCIDQDKLVRNHRNRLRVISMAMEKNKNMDWILSKIQEKDHFVVYCGDGKLFDDNKTELRHIEFIKMKLNDQGFKASQFTANENMSTRMQLVESFNRNDISALAAIRCLDEGINIPSIKSALILSSNDDYKEFVQRRGRILRNYEGKDHANIYDVIVRPSKSLNGFAQIELRRFYEFSKLAKNGEALMPELYTLLDAYDLKIDDIIIKTDLIQEDGFDE